LDSIYKTSWGLYVDISKLNAVHLIRYAEPADYCLLILYLALAAHPIEVETNATLGPVQEDEIVKQWKKHKGEL